VTLAGRHVLLGVSGGIASYKACTLARRLAESGTAVDVVLTASAAEFVGPVTFEALTGRPVHTSLWDRGRPLAHLSLAQEADLVVLAPATAHLIARAAQGLADDLLTTMLLARTGPVLVAPAMNDAMFAHPATQANLATLRARGWHVVGPEVGALAEGPSDRPGRMSEPETVLIEARRLLDRRASKLDGRRVVVTAGPTREHLDPIRVLTNISSGRMGFALAAEAYARGADVTLVAGPTPLPAPHGPTRIAVETTAEMASAVLGLVGNADALLMAAAPADFRPSSPLASKRKRGDGILTVEMDPTEDILETTRSSRKAGSVTVGFAYETEDGVARARAKRTRKGLDLVVLNVHADDAGAEVETNRVTLITADADTPIARTTKVEVAAHVLDAVERLL